MSYVNLNMPDDQLARVTRLANKLKLNRSAYIREAINYYIDKTERELLAEQFKHASEKCRVESLAACREFENVDNIPE